MWESVAFRQILLITDGGSNVGESPITAAAWARQQGVPINVVGILDSSFTALEAESEIRETAQAGGGNHRIVTLADLSKTMHMLTQHTQKLTIEQAVQHQLRQMFGAEATELHPQKRMEVAFVSERAQEESILQVVVLIDNSGSMQGKMERVLEAVDDFEAHLTARRGMSSVALQIFPGQDGRAAEMIMPFQSLSNQRVSTRLQRFKPSGTTPTGPAIREAVRYFLQTEKPHSGDMSSYVV